MIKNKNIYRIKCSDDCKNELEITDLGFNQGLLLQILSSYRLGIFTKLKVCLDFMLNKYFIPKSDNIIISRYDLLQVIRLIEKDNSLESIRFKVASLKNKKQNILKLLKEIK